jgi:16S rRNA (adenine1518-N6/adenine1519-N6)-dimethyltransferase
MSLADLPPVREALDAAGLLAKKTFGQHFLLDLNITRKIARLAGPLEGATVIEVGPGPGGLTRALLEAGARVIAVEKDPRFRPLLEDIAAAASGALTITEADALKIDETAVLAERGLIGPAHVVSNLPYNVGTALLLKWLTGPFRPASMTLMFQREVAERVVAKPGDEAYGRLAVICAALTRAQILMDLPARAFTPPPKVASAVVRFDPQPGRLGEAELQALQTVTAAAFGQRRKMLRSSLKGLGGEVLCLAAEIDPSRRAEEIDLAGFLRLAAALRA